MATLSPDSYAKERFNQSWIRVRREMDALNSLWYIRFRDSSESRIKSSTSEDEYETF